MFDDVIGVTIPMSEPTPDDPTPHPLQPIALRLCNPNDGKIQISVNTGYEQRTSVNLDEYFEDVIGVSRYADA